MSFLSYAQNYEDVILWRALHDVERGFYVDVGAADPDEDSVTRAFYDRGWSGINVEPLDEHFDKLRRARPRDTNLKLAVAREAGVRTLHAIAGSGLSTFDPQIAARHRAAGWETQETIVRTLTLEEILEDCAKPTIHFLKIDVEGAEAEVLEGLNLARVRPWIILVEAVHPNSTVNTRDRWEHHVIGQGYEFAYFDGLNCFYVAAEVSRLEERLAVPPNFFDEFVRRSEFLARERVSVLEQELAHLRNHAHGLEQSVREGIQRMKSLQSELEEERTRTAELERTLQAELQKQRTRTAELERALQAELAGKIRAEQRSQELEQALATPIVTRALRLLRQKGDRITRGGLRSLAKRTFQKTARWAMRQPQILATAREILRPFPKLTTTLYNEATKVEEVPAALLAKSLPPDESAMVDVLPASARKAYRTLLSLILEAEVTDRTNSLKSKTDYR